MPDGPTPADSPTPESPISSRRSLRKRDSHIFDRDQHDHYVEPEWVSERLFAVEPFKGVILDPACGWCRITEAAERTGFTAVGGDIVRRHPQCYYERDFLGPAYWPPIGGIVSNPPFNLMQEFIERACEVMRSSVILSKVAMICPVRRLPAATWLEKLPLATVWLLTPRPSMPTADHILAGGKVGGGTQDYCWLVFKRGWHIGREPKMGWLHREAGGLL